MLSSYGTKFGPTPIGVSKLSEVNLFGSRIPVEDVLTQPDFKDRLKMIEQRLGDRACRATGTGLIEDFDWACDIEDWENSYRYVLAEIAEQINRGDDQWDDLRVSDVMEVMHIFNSFSLENFAGRLAIRKTCQRLHVSKRQIDRVLFHAQALAPQVADRIAGSAKDHHYQKLAEFIETSRTFYDMNLARTSLEPVADLKPADIERALFVKKSNPIGI